MRIAVLGMITPAIPSWLPEKLWSGLHFEEMEPCARKWVKIIKEKENPDVIVGLFHAGKSGNVLGQVVEDASMDVAKRVPGFDVVLMVLLGFYPQPILDTSHSAIGNIQQWFVNSVTTTRP